MTSHLCLIASITVIFPIFQDVAFAQTDTNPLIEEFQIQGESEIKGKATGWTG